MAASSQIPHNKQGRDEYLNSGRLASPAAKRTNSGTLGRDCNLMALLDKIDSVDNNNSNIEDTCTVVNDIEGEMRPNVVINSLENVIGFKVQTDNNIEFTDEKSSTEQMGSNKQGQFTVDRDSEATSLTLDTGDFPYYDDAYGEIGFFEDHYTLNEIGILQNYLYGDSIPGIMYPDPVPGYVENTEVFYGSLWEDDIWH